MANQFLAYRTDFDGSPWYVCQLLARPGTARARRDGVDWGYTTERTKAMLVSKYWANRFRKYVEDCGHIAHVLEVETGTN